MLSVFRSLRGLFKREKGRAAARLRDERETLRRWSERGEGSRYGP